MFSPSFGIGRILYALIEHSYWVRDGDENRTVLSFLPHMAPYLVSILPLMRKDAFLPIVAQLEDTLGDLGFSYEVDNVGVSIGKRYARSDEIGTPFCITVDYDSVTDGSVTLRERDSTKQVRGSQAEILTAVENIYRRKESWEDVLKRLPTFELKEK
jgi:glycyl-tRNA synthetase